MDAAWPSIVLLWERGQPALDSLAHHLPPIIYLWFRLPTPHLTSSQQSTSGLFPPLGVCLLLASRPCPHSLFYINRAYQSQFIHPSPHIVTELSQSHDFHYNPPVCLGDKVPNTAFFTGGEQTEETVAWFIPSSPAGSNRVSF